MQTQQTRRMGTAHSCLDKPFRDAKRRKGVVVLLYIALCNGSLSMIIYTFLDDTLQAMGDIDALCMRPCSDKTLRDPWQVSIQMLLEGAWHENICNL